MDYIAKIEVIQGKITLIGEVENVYEKRVTPFGTSAKVGAPRKYIGRRAYVTYNHQGMVMNLVLTPVNMLDHTRYIIHIHSFSSISL